MELEAMAPPTAAEIEAEAGPPAAVEPEAAEVRTAEAAPAAAEEAGPAAAEELTAEAAPAGLWWPVRSVVEFLVSMPAMFIAFFLSWLSVD